MSELYIFDQDDVLLTVLSKFTGLVSAPFRDELNRVADEPFTFTVEADIERAKHVKEENQVVFRDREGDLRLFVIKEVDDLDNIEGPKTTATCEPAFMELKEKIIVDRRFAFKNAQEALDAALEDTRWEGTVEVELGLATTNFYYISSVDAIWRILEVWGGDFKDVVTFDGNRITKREIRIKQRLGADRGLRFEIDHNIEEIERTVLSYPVTALYGRGASLPIEDNNGERMGGYTRYIDFADVEWKKSNGDPVDKPLGQKWVGDPDALERYGRLHGEKLLHREGIFKDHNIEDPAELLSATWFNLQKAQHPVVNYRLSVDLLDKKAELGDTAVGIDRQFARPLEIQMRIIAIEYDLLDIEGTTVVEMGQFLDLDDDRIDRIEEEIDRNRGKWEHPDVDEDLFPDIKPGTPTNVAAEGLFRTIRVSWDYDGDLAIHYEVYGSQVADFVPDEQHLLWRGKVSSFAHEAETGQTWYYYVRAVNTHGTPSDFSGRVSAKTVQLDLPDLEDIVPEFIEYGIYEGGEPPETEEYTFWLDTSNEPNILHRWNGEDWIPLSPMKPEDIGAVSEVKHEIDIDSIRQSVTELEMDYETFVSEAESTFEQHADMIEQRVAKTTYETDMDAMTVRVSEAESSIEQHADMIVQRVEKNEVISAIEQSPEQIKISAERVAIDGDLVVENGKVYIKDGIITNELIAGDAKIDFAKMANVEITDAMITSISADKILAGTITVGTGRRIDVRDGNLYSYQGNDLAMKWGQYRQEFYARDGSEIGYLGPNTFFDEPNIQGLSLAIQKDYVTIGKPFDGLVRPAFRYSDADKTTFLLGAYNNALVGSKLELYANARIWSADGSDTRPSDQPCILLYQGGSSDSYHGNGNDMMIYFGGYNDRSGANLWVRHNSSSESSTNIIRARNRYVRVFPELRLGPTDHPSRVVTYDDSIHWRLNSNNYIRQSQTQVNFFIGGSRVHTFFENGTKTGGTIKIDGEHLGMSPIDSPQILIEYIEVNIPLSQSGTRILLDSRFVKATEGFSVFPNNGKVIEKGDDYFVIAGNGTADCRIVGPRVGYAHTFWADMSEEEEDKPIRRR